MAKISQVNFYNGQYDRSLQGKEGSEFIKTATYYSKNCCSSNNGELRKRLGSRLIQKLTGKAVLVPFRNDSDDLLNILTDSFMECYDYNDNGSISLHKANAVTSTLPSFTSNTSGIYTVSGGNSFDGITSFGANCYKAFGAAPYGTTIGIDNYLAWYPSEPRFSYVVFDLAITSPRLINDFKIYWYNANNTGYTGFINCVIQYSDNGTDWTSVKTDITNQYFTGSVRYGATLRTANQIISNVSCSYGQFHNYWRLYFYDFVGARTGTSAYFRVNMPHTLFNLVDSFTPFTSATNFIESSFNNIKYAQSNKELILVADGIYPQKHSLVGSTMTWANTMPTSPANFWTTYGYPTCIEYFQNRLWYGGFSLFPQTLKASKFGNYADFSVSSPIVATDGLTLTSNQLKCQIKNIKGGEKTLYAFSEDGISMVYGADGSIIATGNPAFDLKNREPVSNVTPTVKDDIMYYASSIKKDIYALDYDFIVNRFKANRMSSNATQVLLGKIKELHYANGKNKYVYGLLEDGTMFNYLTTSSGINGFFPMDTQGEVSDIMVLKHGSFYKLLMVVKREGEYYLEELLDEVEFVDTTYLTGDDRLFATIDNLTSAIALDCYQKYSDETAQLIRYDSVEGQLVISASESYPMDLTDYIGQQIKVVNSDTDWAIFEITSAGDDSLHWNVTLVKQRGTAIGFAAVRLPFTIIPTGFSTQPTLQVIGSSSYLGDFVVDGNGNITLPESQFEVIFGFGYTAEARIRIENPIESLKKISQINVSCINTNHLEVGTHLDYLLEIEKQEQQSSYDALPYTINATFRMVIEDTPEWTKDIIVKSIKGLPFTINKIDVILEGGQLKGN